MLRKKAVDPAEHRDFVPAPERGQQKFLCAVSCQPLYYCLGRQAKKLAAHNADVFLPRERGDRAVFPFAGKARAAENVQKMNFHPAGPQQTDGGSGFQHHVLRFAGQTVDQMDTHADSPFCQSPVRGEKFRIAVAAVDPVCRFLVNRLESQLHGEIRFPVQLREQIKHVRRQTVGARGDAQTADAGDGKRFGEQGAQTGNGRVGVGV